MRNIWTFIFCLVAIAATAQTVDIDEYDQNMALQDTSRLSLMEEEQRIASYPTITEVYQIPAYDLYDQYWDINHLRSRALDIPFANDRLMLLLVQASNNPFSVPCAYDALGQTYGLTKKGQFHPGVDLRVEPQTLVKACFDGVVRMSCHYGNYGLMVVVRHYNGLETVYAHLDKTCVKPGQIVQAGNVIGQAGYSENMKEGLLHFETRFMNEFFNPELIVDFENETLIKNTLVFTPEEFKIMALDELRPGKIVAKPIPATPTERRENNCTNTPSNPSTAPANNPQYHIVQKGETLYRIALNYKTTMDNILKLNNLPDADKIAEGQRLRVQ